MPSSVPLTRLVPGGLHESVHRGSVVLTEGGDVRFACGDGASPVYFRSTAKPFQAMVLITSGAAAQFDLDDESIAVAAGSHNAKPEQLAAVTRILEKAGVREERLQCGGHWSIDKRYGRVQARGRPEDPDPLPVLWSNCSGKHAAMLAAAKAMGVPREGYLDAAHPVQRAIHEIVATFCGITPSKVALGTDGCGAPVHAVPLTNMAHALARLGAPSDLTGTIREAAERVAAAMLAHPGMVAGERRFDTDLMTRSEIPLLSKSGAEGIQGVAVPERAMGLAVTVDDGNDRGYRQVVIELLRREGVLSNEEAEDLAERHGRTVRNYGGTPIGHLEVLI